MKSRTRRLFSEVCLAAALGLVALFLLWPYRADFSGTTQESTRIYDRQGRLMRIQPASGDTLCEPVRLAQAGDWAARAAVAAEDKRFYRHGGIDIIAILRSAFYNLVHGRVVSGASTISTLVVKQKEPRPRNLLTKMIEAHHAVAMERQMSKDAILEQYLNSMPFGANIRGVEMASRMYFGKSARDLSLAESALLMGLPQSPSRLRPDRYPERAAKRRTYVLEKMKACGWVTPGEVDAAVAGGLPVVHRNPLPFGAPHFCDMILKRYPAGAPWRTTLDLDLQGEASGILRTEFKEIGARGVKSGAVVVIDVKAAALRVMAGSPDYREAAAGQVNGALAQRSPGSALKPFVYAMALDQGMATPQTLAADVPMSYHGYQPKNFSTNFCGAVSVRTALVRSLNIPAITCVNRIGLTRTARCFRELGFSTLDKPAEYYGLSIAIGTCEVTLTELANAYAALAREGLFVPLRCMENETVGEGTRVFSAEACWMTADMLSGEERQFDVSGHTADTVLPRVAWKTGTSSGSRDAWAVAYNPDYVVGVWLGNPAGDPAPSLTSKAAAGVAFKVFRKLYPAGQSPWFRRPEGLKTREVCAVSGCVPNPDCPARVTDDCIPGISATETCSIHRRLAEGGGEAGRVAEVWPAELERFFRTRGMADSRRDGQAAAGSGRAAPVKIVTPSDHETFGRLEDTPAFKQELKLCAAAGAGAGRLYWFMDGTLLREADKDESVLWPLQKGRHRIACTDAAGNSDQVEIRVE